jgi:hypothetical protein
LLTAVPPGVVTEIVPLVPPHRFLRALYLECGRCAIERNPGCTAISFPSISSAHPRSDVLVRCYAKVFFVSFEESSVPKTCARLCSTLPSMEPIQSSHRYDGSIEGRPLLVRVEFHQQRRLLAVNTSDA